jgi:hypothetical protein
VSFMEVLQNNGHWMPCPGPLVWFDVNHFPCKDCGGRHRAAILECSACQWIVTSGNMMDPAHAYTTIIRSPQ